MKRVLSILLMILVTAQAAFAAEQVFFYHTDHAGTPLAMTDSTGKVVWKADYRPFGEEQSVTQTQVNDKRFVGKEKDTETGLSYFGARYMDAKTGRFIAPDPVRAVDPKTSKTNEKMLLNPQRLNTYAYALNNPYRYIDPDGKAPLLTAEEMGTNKVLIGGGGIRSASEGTMARPTGGGGSGIRTTSAEISSSRFISGVTVESRGQVIGRGTVDLQPTLKRINSGVKYPHGNDGGVFENREGLLPRKNSGYYKEHVVPTPNTNGPGPQRVVTGQGGEVFYTPNHYKTFIPVK
ncbi:MAG: RHS domain-containing protein [Geobacteraceae bacterium]|nr:RHS domain-containing protein [Geobacteraceae bacterium]